VGSVPTFCVSGVWSVVNERGSTVRLDRVRELAARAAASRGLEVFEVQFRRESHGWILRV
jgi:hypothetical protein